MKTRAEDTIAAIATPTGEGAIAVIRVSGPDCLSIVDGIFRGQSKLVESMGFRAHYGRIVDANGEPVDEVVVTVFRRPHSYTGDDSAEISCHGGVLVANEVLETTIAAGARQADPGEFTKRAFLNGRIDLSQAEAVADLISSRSEKARKASVNQLDGRLKQLLYEARSGLIEICSLLEVELDFLEEGLPLISTAEVKDKVDWVSGILGELIGSYEVGRIYRDGVSVALVGSPNVGKSSIFNALLRANRAIVSPTPGTTRDYLEESISIRGVQFRLLDTAGLRKSSDSVEEEGIRRTQNAMAAADIIMLIDDVTSPATDSLEFPGSESVRPGNQKILRVRNKIDLLPEKMKLEDDLLRQGIQPVSAKTGSGLESLTTSLLNMSVSGQNGNEASVYVTNRRHHIALVRAKESLGRAKSLLHSSIPNEVLAFEVREAIDALGEVTGEVTTEEILNQIFARFCIGK